MMDVKMSEKAMKEFQSLDTPVKQAVLEATRKLGAYPEVSGVKHLEARWKGYVPSIQGLRVGEEMHTIAASPLELMGVRFVVIPEADYQNLLRLSVGHSELDKELFDLDKLENAEAFMATTLGEDLRAARETAGLTQAELARKLRKSQALVSAAERGTTQVGQRYVENVLKACGLPKNWKPAQQP